MSCRPGLSRQKAYLRNLLWEGSHLIMHASDACQAGLFPQLIFFHILPCRPNLIILAPRQTATAFRWCIQYQRPLVTGWSIRWRGRVLARDSAPQSNEASYSVSMGRTGYIRNAWRPIGGYLRSAPTHLYSINRYQSGKMFLERRKSAELRGILKCLWINKTCRNGCQVAPGMRKCAAVSKSMATTEGKRRIFWTTQL